MKMKKFLALTMTLGLVLMSAGCGNKGEAEKQDTPLSILDIRANI